MHGSLAEVRKLSTVSVEQVCKFGTIVRALWPTKPALNLAQRIGCTERNALYLISGERKVTAKAVAAIIAEMIE